MKRSLALETALNSTLVLCIAGVVLLVRARSVTFGSEKGGWVYPYIADFQLFPLLTGIGLSLALVPLVHLSLHLVNRYQLRVLALWLVVGLAGQLLLHSLYPYSLEDIVRSDTANAFYGVSLRYQAYDILSRYHALAQSLPVHARSNMPGKILLYHGLRLVTGDPQSLAILIIAISNLGGILLYFIVSTIYASRAIALSSLVLYLFIPAKIYFLPLLNIVSPVPMLACLLLVVRFLASRRRLLAVLLGVGLYVALLFDPLTFSLGFFFVALIARSWWSGEVCVADVLWLGTLAPAGFLVVHLAMWLGLHFDVVHRFIAVSAEAREFSRTRPYAVWVWANLPEFFLNASALPSLLCFVYVGIGVVEAIRSLSARSLAYPAVFSLLLVPGPLLLATLLVTLAVLDLLGLNRGEIVRLWIFIAVFVQVVAAGFCCEKARRCTVDIVLAGSIIQTAATISMVGFILGV